MSVVRKYCPGCDSVGKWDEEDRECDCCGEELLAHSAREMAVSLLIDTHEKLEQAEADRNVALLATMSGTQADVLDAARKLVRAWSGQVMLGPPWVKLREAVKKMVEGEA